MKKIICAASYFGLWPSYAVQRSYFGLSAFIRCCPAQLFRPFGLHTLRFFLWDYPLETARAVSLLRQSSSVFHVDVGIKDVFAASHIDVVGVEFFGNF